MSEINAFFETDDGAKIYYEERGSGRTILLLHGWLCSSKFWAKNADALAQEFRVVTMDLRGHGNSSKILTGHTVGRYAEDVRGLIERLGLDQVALAGWSLAGSVVLEYWKKYARDSRLAGLGLVDSAVAPFNPGEWNSHVHRGFNLEGMHATIRALSADSARHAVDFANRMFTGGKAPPRDIDWLVGEIRKTPAWIGAAIYSDFLFGDYSKVLPTVTIPSFVYAADSNVYKKGMRMGEYLAKGMNGKYLAFENAGHALFLEQAEKFNGALGKFVREL